MTVKPWFETIVSLILLGSNSASLCSCKSWLGTEPLSSFEVGSFLIYMHLCNNKPTVNQFMQELVGKCP